VILLFFVFFAVPLALDVDIPPYPAAIAALSVHCSAYMGEVVRSGIESIPTGSVGGGRLARAALSPHHAVYRVAAGAAGHDPADDRRLCQHDQGILARLGHRFVELLGQGMASAMATSTSAVFRRNVPHGRHSLTQQLDKTDDRGRARIP